MKRAAVPSILAVVMLLAVAVIAEAQQPTKIYRVGYLDLSSASGSTALLQAFRERLSEHGWVDGKNISFEYRFAEGIRERLPELAAELVRMKVDILVVRSNTVANAAKQATKTIPIVMTSSTDPVAAGLVASLAYPGANVTGLVSQPPGLTAKRLELLKEVVDKVTRVGVLVPAGIGAGEGAMKELKIAGPTLKVILQELRIKSEPNAFEDAFQTAVQKRVDAIMTLSNPFFFGERRRIIDLAAKRRLPAMYNQGEFVEVGGLMSYGVDIIDLYHRAAVYVDKIFKGAKPSDLPVEQPKKFEFIINLKAAKQIGLTIPPNVLVRADRVIK